MRSSSGRKVKIRITFLPKSRENSTKCSAKWKARDRGADKARENPLEKAKEKNQDKVLQATVEFVSNVLKTRSARAERSPGRDVPLDAPPVGRRHSVCFLARPGPDGRVAARQEAAGPVSGPPQPFAALYGTAGLLSLFEAYRTPPAPIEATPPAPDQLPLAGSIHPDDQDAIALPPGPSLEENPEAQS